MARSSSFNIDPKAFGDKLRRASDLAIAAFAEEGVQIQRVVVEEAKANLAPVKASGVLADSGRAEVQGISRSGVMVDAVFGGDMGGWAGKAVAGTYVQIVNRGYMSPGTTVPINALRQWADHKGLDLSDGALFTIRRNIKERGIQYRGGQDFLLRAHDDLEGYMVKQLGAAIAGAWRAGL